MSGSHQFKRRNSGLPKMESVTRLSSIPVVESSLRTAEDAYFRLKVSSSGDYLGFAKQ